ncbi:unnamed protein product [Polarella glacialis]|uniref:Uncharacterized protein n=1 Tax=Polarella glacialis TaxID=89957 RepID=A0A813IQE8_POLGL|nr:unnamed protein product [Polarella glacialis]
MTHRRCNNHRYRHERLADFTIFALIIAGSRCQWVIAAILKQAAQYKGRGFCSYIESSRKPLAKIKLAGTLRRTATTPLLQQALLGQPLAKKAPERNHMCGLFGRKSYPALRLSAIATLNTGCAKPLVKVLSRVPSGNLSRLCSVTTS